MNDSSYRSEIMEPAYGSCAKRYKLESNKIVILPVPLETVRRIVILSTSKDLAV